MLRAIAITLLAFVMQETLQAQAEKLAVKYIANLQDIIGNFVDSLINKLFDLEVIEVFKLVNEGCYIDAAKLLQASLTLKPDEVQLLYLMGATQQKLGLPLQALEWYKRAADVNPSFETAFYAMGCLLHQLGKSDEALEALQIAVRLSPTNANAWHELGFVHWEKFSLDDVKEAWNTAVALSPDDSSLWYDRGRYLLAVSKYSEAIAALQTSIQLRPTNADAFFLLGMLQQQTVALDDAQKAVGTAVMLRPDDYTLRYKSASMLRAIGKFNDSFKEQLQAVQLASISCNRSDFIDQIPQLERKLVPHDKSCFAFAPANVADSAITHIGVLAVTAGDARLATQLKNSAFHGFPSDWIERVRRVQITRVATKAQCEWAIATADTHAKAVGGWDKMLQGNYRTPSINTVDNDELRKWVQALLRYAIWPAMKLHFGIDPSGLWPEDVFLSKYQTDGQAGVERHMDNSELSFNLLLSDPASFDGGGTAFFDAEQEAVDVGGTASFDAEQEAVVLQPAQGEVITHCGFVEHAGKPVIGAAPRYILAGFVMAAPLAKKWKELRMFQGFRALASSS